MISTSQSGRSAGMRFCAAAIGSVTRRPLPGSGCTCAGVVRPMTPIRRPLMAKIAAGQMQVASAGLPVTFAARMGKAASWAIAWANSGLPRSRS